MRRATAAACITFAAIACGSHPVSPPPSARGPRDVEAVEVVESPPLETTLNHAEVHNAADVWLEMVRGARRSIDLAEFYVSDSPGSHLHAVLEELQRAAARGVHVRLLVDETFHEKYPEIPDAWAHLPNMETRRIDLRPGVLHAKYFIVDGRDAYVGSQNFDWRSLDHIFEIGARIRNAHIGETLSKIFQADWDHAGGAAFRLEADSREEKLDGAALILRASPKGMTPEPMWDLPQLIGFIHEAKSRLRISVLTYKTKNRDGSEFHDLDEAVREAAGRGVRVQLLVSTWGEKDAAIQSLATVHGVEVRTFAIPPHSSGDIPFARVAHAKYAIFDEARAWIGTSNWEGDYFLHSRNISLFFEHGPVPGVLARVFEDIWGGPYARLVQPSPE